MECMRIRFITETERRKDVYKRQLIAGLMGERLPVSIEDKKEMLLRNGIAVWDVIQKCDIIGSSDSSIRNVIPADINMVLERSSIKRLYANGGKAYELYMKYCYQDTKREISCLLYTSRFLIPWEIGAGIMGLC